jgi:hypothetical protein
VKPLTTSFVRLSLSFFLSFLPFFSLSFNRVSPYLYLLYVSSVPLSLYLSFCLPLFCLVRPNVSLSVLLSFPLLCLVRPSVSLYVLLSLPLLCLSICSSVYSSSLFLFMSSSLNPFSFIFLYLHPFLTLCVEFVSFPYLEDNFFCFRDEANLNQCNIF